MDSKNELREVQSRVHELNTRVKVLEELDAGKRLKDVESFKDRASWTWTIARHSITAGGLLWALIVWLKKHIIITTSASP